MSPARYGSTCFRQLTSRHPPVKKRGEFVLFLAEFPLQQMSERTCLGGKFVVSAQFPVREKPEVVLVVEAYATAEPDGFFLVYPRDAVGVKSFSQKMRAQSLGRLPGRKIADMIILPFHVMAYDAYGDQKIPHEREKRKDNIPHKLTDALKNKKALMIERSSRNEFNVLFWRAAGHKIFS